MFCPGEELNSLPREPEIEQAGGETMRTLSCSRQTASNPDRIRTGQLFRLRSMTTLTLRGDQLGEALQFDPNASTTAVEIGRVWFSASDTVRITFAPGSFDPVSGQLVGGAGAVTGLTVTTADGRTTNFGASLANPLDVDPDGSKNGADFFYISESPSAGVGGAYAGLQLEKIVVSDASLANLPINRTLNYSNLGGYLPAGGSITPPPPQLSGTPQDDVLTGTASANTMNGFGGNDLIRALGGNDTVNGGDGNDVLDGADGADRLDGGNGNDRLIGGGGNDQLLGRAGDDLMDGGGGSDNLTGGLGGDTFVFGAGDTVIDFNRNQGDQIHFAEALGLSESSLIITRTAQGTLIGAAGVSGTMLLLGYSGQFDIGNDFKFDYIPSNDFL